jgi:hypothetical protein
MNGESRGHRPRLAELRLLGVLLAMLGAAVLAACSSPGSTGSGGGSTSSAYAKALAYAQCIRAHGVPKFPDPNSKGQFFIPNGSSTSLKVSKAVSVAATKACQKLLPPSMAQGPPKGSQGAKAASRGLRFSECMRSHGEPNFPDPAANGSITLPPGMNYQSPQFKNASKDCQSLRSAP